MRKLPIKMIKDGDQEEGIGEQNPGGNMTIREVSEKYEISQDTLRYYERVGMIPPVTRTESGIRDYQEKDLGWVELAMCMRSAGLTVDAMIQYVRLSQTGDSTFARRCTLLQEQREHLLKQRARIDAALERLNYKISRYEAAVKSGKLSWEKSADPVSGMNSNFGCTQPVK